MQSEAAIRNLRLLIARASTYGSPTSRIFCAELRRGGASIQEPQLSRWLTGDEPLASWDAARIERAASVPSGWLEQDFGFIFQASPDLLTAFRRLAGLPANQQAAIAQLLEALRSEREVAEEAVK